VKTIGDAVTATFETPDSAIAAAIRMREAVSDLGAQRRHQSLRRFTWSRNTDQVSRCPVCWRGRSPLSHSTRQRGLTFLDLRQCVAFGAKAKASASAGSSGRTAA
jgi:hypothetical protein